MDRDSSNFGDFLGFTYIPVKPQISGMLRGQGNSKLRGHFGDGVNPNFGDLLWFIPEKPQISGMGTGLQLQKCLGMLWGWGNPKLWGYLGKIPENPQFSVWGRGKESRGFLPH